MLDIFLFSLCQLNITSIIHGTPKIDETVKFWLLKNFNKHLLNHNLLVRGGMAVNCKYNQQKGLYLLVLIYICTALF